MPSESAREWIARMQALCDKTTEGPWYVVGPPWNDGEPYIVAGAEDPNVGRYVADFASEVGDVDDERQASDDAALTAEARTALPAALACLTELLDLPASHGPDDAPSRLTYYGDTIHAIIERHLGAVHA